MATSFSLNRFFGNKLPYFEYNPRFFKKEYAFYKI